MKKTVFLLLSLFLSASSLAYQGNYPSHWWEEVDPSERRGRWEILPQEANRGEVILSKRNELGAFSNLAHTPFVLDGVNYASIEALWQMMKYPDPEDKYDPRTVINDYPFARKEIFAMYGFDSKKAGNAANKINKKFGFKLISYQGYHFDYKDLADGSKFHYKLIKRAIKAKIAQNPKLKKLLKKTKRLILKPDHKISAKKPKSYFYNRILMDIRKSL